ncbi:MAG: protein kinase [Phycisphaerae bacterium]|nr:protein kinase [Gemmatimonadaceae bacterium]
MTPSGNSGTPSGATHAAHLDALDAAALRERIQKAVAGSYTIESEIGRGGMAVVYAARDTKLRRIVALKVLPPDLAFRADVRARFVREAQTAAGLNHPNIVPIYAVDERDGMVYFAMSLINGETLATQLIREPRPAIQVVESILVQVADALAYAHVSGVVHRDIKPDNVLIDAETGRATVTDFGIARALEGGSRLTQTGIAVGTPAFMSPEQATGEREIDGRSDVYSLGILGYLMLAGRLPFEATSTPAMLMKHVSERPAPLREYRPDAPPALVAIIERCLAKSPNDRWPNAGELRDAIKGAAAGTFSGTRNSNAAPRAMSSPAPLPPMPGLRTVVPPSGVQRNGQPNAQQNAPGAGVRGPHAGAQPNGPRQQRTEAEWRQQYALGKRAADWTPPLAPMPVGGSRRDFREWRKEVKAQREDARQLFRDERNALASEQGISRGDAAMALTSPDKLIHRFRGNVIRSGLLISFLGFINVAQNIDFPWVIFPAFGITMGLVSRYSKLREQGISLGDILRGESSKAKAVAGVPEDPNTLAGRMANATRKFRSHVRWTGLLATVSAGSLSLLIASRGADEFGVAMVVSGGLASVNALRALWFDRRRMKKLGLTMSDAWNERWRVKAIPPDTRPRDVRLRDRAEQLVGASVLASSLGGYVRSAVEDHATIKETSSKLTDADRVLVPDVDPTADALLERISAIAGSLERLERDLPGDAMNGLADRIRSVEAESENAPDRERRLSLLSRQQSSLQDLVQRKETLQRQLESASMALRSLRLDMVKLSALGMGALGDVTNATQEARALSKDIARALYAADEVRKL